MCRYQTALWWKLTGTAGDGYDWFKLVRPPKLQATMQLKYYKVRMKFVFIWGLTTQNNIQSNRLAKMFQLS